jgi:hypothetical protein
MEDRPGLFVIPLGVLGPLAAGALIRLYGFAWPRWYWLRRPPAQRQAWLGFGWAPSALALLVAAAIAPPTVAVAFVVGGLATVVLFWALITGLPDSRNGGMPPPGRLALREAALVAWWILLRHQLPVARYVTMSVALAVAIVIGIVAAKPLVVLW